MQRPLQEVWNEEEGQGCFSGRTASLKWDCCGTSVAICDSCDNIVNLTSEMLNATSFQCKHCSFPVLVNNQFRALLNLQPFNYLSFEKVAKAQIRLVGRTSYTLAKSKRLAKLEDELKTSSSFPPKSPCSDLRSKNKRKRWQSTKQKQKHSRLHGNGVDRNGSATATCLDKDLSRRFIQSKWELMMLSKWGDREGRSLRQAISTIEEKVRFLQMLYSRDRHWTSFWDVSFESHENVECICDLSMRFLKESRSILGARDRASAVRDVLRCIQEDCRSFKHQEQEDGSKVNILSSMMEQQSDAASTQFIFRAKQHSGLGEKIRCEVNRIIDCIRTTAMLAEDKEKEVFDGHSKLFPSQAFSLLSDLHRTVYESCN